MRPVTSTLAAACLLAALGSPAFAQVPSGAAATWLLDQTTGTTAPDEANANNASSIGTPAVSWTTGHIGNAVRLDGNNALRVQPATSALKPVSAFAISAWVRFSQTDVSGGEIASMGDSYAMRVLPSSNPGVRVFFYVGNSTWRVLDVPSNLSSASGETWHHVVGQYTGDLATEQLQVYVDGTLVNSLTTSGDVDYSLGASFYIGKHGNGATGRNFRGDIDQVRVYGRSLTATEVAALAAESPNETSSAYWRFDEGIGTTADDSQGSNDLTLGGGVSWTTGGRDGSAAVFDGTNDIGSIAGPTAAVTPTSGYAISAWVRTTTIGSSGAEVVSMGDSYALRLLADGNVTTFFYAGSSTYKGATTTGVNVKDGLWHHLVGQYEAGVMKVYVDGVEKKSVSGVTGTITYTLGTTFYVGRHGSTAARFFNGALDEVRVYGRGLTPSEVAVLASQIGANDPPSISSVTANPTSGTAPLGVSFSVTASDPEAATVTYRWDVDGNGTTDYTTQSPSHTYPAAGTFNPRVTVVDDIGNWRTQNAPQITVSSSAPGSGRTFKYMTYNVHRLTSPLDHCMVDQVADHIVAQGASVVAFQELNGADVGGGCGFSDQAVAMQQKLNARTVPVQWGYHYTYGAAVFWRADLLDSGGAASGQDYHAYTPTQYLGRILTVTLPINGRDVAFFSTHLSYYCPSSDPGCNMSNVRNSQVTQFKDQLINLTSPYRVIGGDMNFDMAVPPPSNPPAEYQNLTTGYTDAWVYAYNIDPVNHDDAVHAEGPGHHRTRTESSSRFDMVFVSNGSSVITIDHADVTKPTKNGEDLSDHMPVIVTVTVN